MGLWCKNPEKLFSYYSKKFPPYEHLFYKISSGRYVAGLPKEYYGAKSTL